MSQSPSPLSNPAQAYEDYMVPGLFRPWAGEVIQRAKPQSGERILDLACGSGIVARLVAQQLPGQAFVVGLDINPSMIEVARATAEREGASIEWHVGSADALPFAEAAFDLVVVQQGLQFFPDRIAAAKEIFRVLVPGGRLVTATWTDLERNPFSQVMSDVVERHLGSAVLATAYALGSRDALLAVFVKSGFDPAEVTVVQRDVWFASPDRFIDLTMAARAAAIPAMQALDEARRVALVDAMRDDLRGLVEQHTHQDRVVYRQESHIAVARKPGELNPPDR